MPTDLFTFLPPAIGPFLFGRDLRQLRVVSRHLPPLAVGGLVLPSTREGAVQMTGRTDLSQVRLVVGPCGSVGALAPYLVGLRSLVVGAAEGEGPSLCALLGELGSNRLCAVELHHCSPLGSTWADILQSQAGSLERVLLSATANDENVSLPLPLATELVIDGFNFHGSVRSSLLIDFIVNLKSTAQLRRLVLRDALVSGDVDELIEMLVSCVGLEEIQLHVGGAVLLPLLSNWRLCLGRFSIFLAQQSSGHCSIHAVRPPSPLFAEMRASLFSAPYPRLSPVSSAPLLMAKQLTGKGEWTVAEWEAVDETWEGLARSERAEWDQIRSRILFTGRRVAVLVPHPSACAKRGGGRAQKISQFPTDVIHTICSFLLLREWARLCTADRQVHSRGNRVHIGGLSCRLVRRAAVENILSRVHSPCLLSLHLVGPVPFLRQLGPLVRRLRHLSLREWGEEWNCFMDGLSPGQLSTLTVPPAYLWDRRSAQPPELSALEEFEVLSGDLEDIAVELVIATLSRLSQPQSLRRISISPRIAGEGVVPLLVHLAGLSGLQAIEIPRGHAMYHSDLASLGSCRLRLSRLSFAAIHADNSAVSLYTLGWLSGHPDCNYWWTNLKGVGTSEFDFIQSQIQICDAHAERLQEYWAYLPTVTRAAWLAIRENLNSEINDFKKATPRRRWPPN